MLSSFKYKPDAQEIIADDAAACWENVAQRIMDPVKIGFPREKVRQRGAEELETSDFHNGTQPSCNDEEQNLFLA